MNLIDRWRRWPTGLRVMLASLALGGVGVAPLLLYIAFGPKDGNPIGLGLLAVFAVPAAGIGMGAGLLHLLWELITRRRA